MTYKVLIVHDEKIVRVFGARVVERSGYEVLQAEDGLEALEVLQQHPDVKVLFTDINMPNMQGDKLIHEAKQLYPELIMYAMTGGATSQEREDVIQYGAKGIIEKPFMPRDLVSILQKEIPQ